MKNHELLDPKIVRMPELPPGTWLNVDGPLTHQDLRGKVILVDFWDYTCVNCVRTLPYLRAWHGRYHDRGLLILGIHAPEFKFASTAAQVATAVDEFGLPYPVLLDNHFQAWSLFANKAWPTRHLVDHTGYIRFRRQGEGYYEETERAIQALLRQRDPGVSLPAPLPPLRDADAPGAVCYRTTPELYAGYQGGGLFGGALGNPEGYVTDGIMIYSLPDEAEWQEGQFLLEGFWRAYPESLAFAGDSGGRVVLPYSAAGVNAVMSPSGDPVEVMLNLRPTKATPLVEVRQDGASLLPSVAGEDVAFDDNGRSFLHIDRPRLYDIVRNSDFENHTLELIFRARGIALYSFTFDTCIAPQRRAQADDVFQRR